MSFVVAEINEDGKPQAFYGLTTSQNLELTEDLQQAFVFSDKPSARQAQSTFQREFNHKASKELRGTKGTKGTPEHKASRELRGTKGTPEQPQT